VTHWCPGRREARDSWPRSRVRAGQKGSLGAACRNRTDDLLYESTRPAPHISTAALSPAETRLAKDATTASARRQLQPDCTPRTRRCSTSTFRQISLVPAPADAARPAPSTSASRTTADGPTPSPSEVASPGTASASAHKTRHQPHHRPAIRHRSTNYHRRLPTDPGPDHRPPRRTPGPLPTSHPHRHLERRRHPHRPRQSVRKGHRLEPASRDTRRPIPEAAATMHVKAPRTANPGRLALDGLVHSASKRWARGASR